MNDQQLLETAALIAGQSLPDWNPLENPAQALAMLKYITPSSDGCSCYPPENFFYKLPVPTDLDGVAEICRAIVVTAVAEYQAKQDFEAHETEAAYLCEESGHQWIEQAREKYIDRTCRRCLFSERIVPDGVTP